MSAELTPIDAGRCTQYSMPDRGSPCPIRRGATGNFIGLLVLLRNHFAL